MQRDRADKNLGQAFKAGEELLTRVAQDQLLKTPMMETLRTDLLTRAMRFYERFLDTEGDSADVRFRTALAHFRLGDIHELLGKYNQSKTAYGKAVSPADRPCQKLAAKPRLPV